MMRNKFSFQNLGLVTVCMALWLGSLRSNYMRTAKNFPRTATRTMSIFLFGMSTYLGVLGHEVSTNDHEEGELVLESERTDVTRKKTILEQLFGDSLYILGYENDSEGNQQKAVFEANLDDLIKDSKVIGVYFSASWCAPCRQFTPILAKFYNEMKQQNRKLEIVWISRDQSSEDFLQYFAKMPWLAVPMQNIQAVNEQLANKYQVKGIPHLTFIDAKTGEIITTEGRTKVLQDPYGLEFPWRGRSVLNLIPSSIKQQFKLHFSVFAQTVRKIFLNLLGGFVPKNVLHRFL